MTTQKKRPEANRGAGQGTKGGGVDKDHSTTPDARADRKLQKRAFRFACQLKGESEDHKPEQFASEIADFAATSGISNAEAFDLITKAWPAVTDDHTLASSIDGWQRDPVPDVGPDWLREGTYADALKVFARLQRAADPDPFYVSGDVLAEVLGVTPRTAYRFLSSAMRDGVLDMAEQARPRRCRRWWMAYATGNHSPPSEHPRHQKHSADSEHSKHSLDSVSSVPSVDSVPSMPSVHSAPSVHSVPSLPSVTCPKCDGEGCGWCHDTGRITSEAKPAQRTREDWLKDIAAVDAPF